MSFILLLLKLIKYLIPPVYLPANAKFKKSLQTLDSMCNTDVPNMTNTQVSTTVIFKLTFHWTCHFCPLWQWQSQCRRHSGFLDFQFWQDGVSDTTAVIMVYEIMFGKNVND